MPEFSTMWAALGYRKGQAVALAALSALVTACAVFAPLYDRTMVQSLVDVRLAATTPVDAGLQLRGSVREQSGWSETSPTPAPAPAELLDRVPGSALASYDDPVLGWTDSLDLPRAGDPTLTGQVLWRTDVCGHVRVVAGRCPTAAGEVLVSTADAEGLGFRPGRTVTMAEPATTPDTAAPGRELSVVGTYQELPGEDWFDQPLTGGSGQLTEDVPAKERHDTWLTVEQTFTSGEPLPLAESYVGLRLRPDRVGVDEVVELGATIERLSAQATADDTGPSVRVASDLPEIAEDVRSQQQDSRVIVPLLMAQLALLGLVVLWLALGTVADLRRSEIAVARLRGRGVRGARRLVLSELLPAVALGLVPGVAVAGAGDLLAARLLPGDAGVEATSLFWLALAAVVLVLLLTTVLAANRVARIPVDALLRRSASVRRGWRVGVLDAVVISACAVVVVAFLSGSLDGPPALVAPALVALLVGLVLAHVLTPLAAAVGRWLLRHGRARSALGLLEAARSPALRSTVTVVTVAAALAVFAVDALVVADRNRAAAADQEAGAPVVMGLSTRDVTTVEAAIEGIDDVTPVVRLKAPAADAVTTLAVRPTQFRQIALLPSDVASSPVWQGLTEGDVEPVAFTGTDLSMTVTDDGLTSTAADGSEVGVTLGADIAEGDHVFHAELGTVPRSGSRRLTTAVDCRHDCALVSLSLSTLVGSTMSGAVTVADVAADGTPVDLGSDWLPFEDPDGGSMQATPDGTGVRVAVETTGQQRVSVSQAWVPREIPALLTSATPQDDFQLTGLDGRTRESQVSGTLARVPGAPERTALVDLDVLQRGATPATDARVELWLGDPSLLDRVTTALASDGITATDTTTLADVRRGYDESTAAWSVQLGVVVGLAALAIALILLTVLSVSGWRVRARDLAALWLSGMPRRHVRGVARTAQLPAVLIGGVAGAAAGLVGAAVSMPIVPLFADAPGVSTLDLATPWLPVLLVAAAALVVLVVWSVVLGWGVFRRAALERLRETA